MPVGRRRPLMRAAMVGGTAYAAGKHRERSQQQQQEQEPPAPPEAAAGGMSDATIKQLQKLGELREAGILTDAEFAAQKQKLLGGQS